jgi:hypothetical protein
MPFLHNELNTSLTPFYRFTLALAWEREAKACPEPVEGVRVAGKNVR